MKLFDYEVQAWNTNGTLVGTIQALSIKGAVKKLIDKFSDDVFQFPYDGTIRVKLKEKNIE